jgi:hypothetical protein
MRILFWGIGNEMCVAKFLLASRVMDYWRILRKFCVGVRNNPGAYIESLEFFCIFSQKIQAN